MERPRGSCLAPYSHHSQPGYPWPDGLPGAVQPGDQAVRNGSTGGAYSRGRSRGGILRTVVQQPHHPGEITGNGHGSADRFGRLAL